MILTCPECATRYQTDLAHFAAEGRKVRCAKCGHVWHQGPLSAQAEPEPEFSAVEETAPVVAAASPPQRTAYAPAFDSAPYPVAPESSVSATRKPDWGARASLATGWLALAAVIAVIGWSAMRFRQEIAMLWPQSASFYAALGRPVNIRGLAIADLSSHNENEDGQSVLTITGRLVNITSHELSVPRIRITLTDDDRRVLYDWSFATSVTTLGPGQAVKFLQRLSSPPSGARHLQAQLADKGG